MYACHCFTTVDELVTVKVIVEQLYVVIEMIGKEHIVM